MCGSEAFFAPFAFGMVTAIFGLIVSLILAHFTGEDWHDETSHNYDPENRHEDGRQFRG